MHDAGGSNQGGYIGIAIPAAIAGIALFKLARWLLAEAMLRWYILQLKRERLNLLSGRRMERNRRREQRMAEAMWEGATYGH